MTQIQGVLKKKDRYDKEEAQTSVWLAKHEEQKKGAEGEREDDEEENRKRKLEEVWKKKKKDRYEKEEGQTSVWLRSRAVSCGVARTPASSPPSVEI